MSKSQSMNLNVRFAEDHAGEYAEVSVTYPVSSLCGQRFEVIGHYNEMGHTYVAVLPGALVCPPRQLKNLTLTSTSAAAAMFRDGDSLLIFDHYDLQVPVSFSSGFLITRFDDTDEPKPIVATKGVDLSRFGSRTPCRRCGAPGYQGFMSFECSAGCR